MGNTKTGGLAGINAGETSLCTVGKEGAGLTYRGYDIYDLVDNASFDSTYNLFQWTPDFSQVGEKEIRFSAETKDGRSTFLDLDIEVQSINIAPIFTKIGALEVQNNSTPKLKLNL